MKSHASLLFKLVVNEDTKEAAQNAGERAMCTLVSCMVAISKDGEEIGNLMIQELSSIEVHAEGMVVPKREIALTRLHDRAMLMQVEEPGNAFESLEFHFGWDWCVPGKVSDWVAYLRA